MSQSGASYALARLRDLVGDPLFLPHPKGVHPTPRALDMAATVSQMLLLAREALSREPSFDPRQARRAFTLGATDYASFVLLPALVERVRREAPGVDLRVRPIDRDSLVPDLDRGALDLGVGLLPDPPDRIRATPLFEERLVCAARRGHPLLQTRSRRTRSRPHRSSWCRRAAMPPDPWTTRSRRSGSGGASW
jgi:DNA-binding transcriptional LysR family regulator